MYPQSAGLDLYRATHVLVQDQVPFSLFCAVYSYEKQNVLKTYIYLNLNAQRKIR